MENENQNLAGNQELHKEINELRLQLQEAHDTLEAIRTGQIDAIVVEGEQGHQLYTLKSADQAYRIFIEQMTEGAVTLNASGFILYCNTTFSTMVGLPSSEILGRFFLDFVHPDDRASYQKLFQGSWTTSDCKGEVLIMKGNNNIPVKLSLTTLQLDEGISLSIIITDLTFQKRIQEQLSQNNEQLAEINKALEESNNDLQQFASVASHDMQEPLRKIQIFSHLMKQRQNDLSPDSVKYLSKIIDAATRMKSLVMDILNYSRLSSGQPPYDWIDLNDLVSDSRDHFELILEEKEGEIRSSELPKVYVNRGQMRQVFQNIISNALKFSRPEVPPLISISAKKIREKLIDSAEDPKGNFLRISIKDNGIGFNKKYEESIFNLFERLNPKDTYEGSGLGLAIAKKIVERHDGIIASRSKEGDGAEFIIVLPLIETPGK